MNIVYGVIGVLITTLGITLWVQSVQIYKARDALTLSEGQLASCGGRLQNLIEDVRSDNAIDALSDDDLRNVPDHWLLPDSSD